MDSDWTLPSPHVRLRSRPRSSLLQGSGDTAQPSQTEREDDEEIERRRRAVRRRLTDAVAASSTTTTSANSTAAGLTTRGQRVLSNDNEYLSRMSEWIEHMSPPRESSASSRRSWRRGPSEMSNRHHDPDTVALPWNTDAEMRDTVRSVLMSENGNAFANEMDALFGGASEGSTPAWQLMFAGDDETETEDDEEEENNGQDTGHYEGEGVGHDDDLNFNSYWGLDTDEDEDDDDGADSQVDLRRMMLDMDQSTFSAALTGANASSYSLAPFWPNLLGTEPLNPCANNSLSGTSPSPALDESAMLHSSRHVNDPSSATSPSSFLLPGVVFSGEQMFPLPFQQSRPAPGVSSSTINFASPYSTLDSSSRSGIHPSWLSYAEMASIPRTSLRTAASSTSLRPMGIPLNPPSSSTHPADRTTVTLSSIPSTPAERIVNDYRQRIDTLSSSGSSVNPANPHPADYPTAARRFGTLSMGAVGRSESERGTAALQGRYDQAGMGGGGGVEVQIAVEAEEEQAVDERWAVRVVIQSFDASSRTLTGLMSASGVPESSTTVVTYFKGEVVDPLFHKWLWKKHRGDRSLSDAEFWARLPPFRGSSPDEMMANAVDQKWTRKRTEGWVLMKWKEQDFVNVASAQSSLSIAGWYYIAMNRSTGALEGLYCDPASSTQSFQKLVLNVSTPNAPFQIGTFGYK